MWMLWFYCLPYNFKILFYRIINHCVVFKSLIGLHRSITQSGLDHIILNKIAPLLVSVWILAKRRRRERSEERRTNNAIFTNLLSRTLKLVYNRGPQPVWRHTGARAEELHHVLVAFVMNHVRHRSRSVAHGALVGGLGFLQNNVRDVEE